MSEPVAYLNKYLDNSTNITRHKPIDKSSILPSNNRVSSTPLYTSEDLHPRVKMTQAEFDEFNSIPESASVYGAMVALYSSNIIKHVKLINRFSGNDGQINFANLWFDYRINNKSQEETIEIVPEMKWFVRSKQPDNSSGHYHFRSGVKHFADYYYAKDKNDNKKAYAFDTKEEAELWTNPLTEAVQLPVEGE
ncbi:hypothetical protein EFT49_05030 [Leuconostoc falkenbergense]|uniref:hypothetical protein n=1 Tax=Leuconostoc falkenbergense TaxID=2766470 RepID=UPI0021A9AED7|nr:hypothetical protein [Leuconostoc falkenbergense]MCT4419579.1 hypothetical protein [Leuconostoc falkenbergense]